MKRKDMYRFCLQFGTDSEDEIRVGEFLESLGRKKSIVVINALIEYLENHPEFKSDNARSRLTVCPMTRDALKEYICGIIEEQLSGIDLNRTATTTPTEQVKDVSQDIVDMLADLDLFNM